MKSPPKEIIDRAYETLADSGVLQTTLDDLLNMSGYPEPKWSDILESVIAGKSITRDESEVLKKLLIIDTIRNKLSEILELERSITVEILHDEVQESRFFAAQSIAERMTIEWLIDWIHRRINACRINMVLLHPGDDEDDKLDMRKFSSDTCTAYISEQNIGIILIWKDSRYEFNIKREFHTEEGVYLQVIKENWTELLLSIESWKFLSIASLFAIKYPEEIHIEHCIWKKKEAFIVGDPGTSRTGYMLNKWELWAWIEIESIQRFLDHPEPVLISKTPEGLEYHYHLNS